MLGTAFDSLVGLVSPRWAARRAEWRLHFNKVAAASSDHQSMRKLLSSRKGGYEAGNVNRTTAHIGQSAHENDLPRQQIEIMQRRSWNLYRNNPQARKICRTLGAKVIGRGLSPQPQAKRKDGTPFNEFRERARSVFEEFCKESDFRGKPGRGGQHFVTQCKTALRSVILSGGVLFRFRHLSKSEQKEKGLFVPLQVQLMHVDRLDTKKHADGNFNGVELDENGKISFYHILKGGINPGTASTPVPVKEMGHLFSEEDIDQILGSPWFGAALLTMDDRRGYESSEILAAEARSCIIGGYKRPTGNTSGLGLPNPDANLDLTDANGNQITRLQPMMFLDLGSDGDIKLLGGTTQNSGAEGFINHLIRGEAVSMPGVKSSTLTGDYRNSSFSSERSADNDIWPEIEELQDWFSCGFVQPIYEECIVSAVRNGLFDDIDGFDVADFEERRREYLKANWQGPVARSINPKDDATAAGLRVKAMNSSPQRECAKVGVDWIAIIKEFSEFIQTCKDNKLPDDFWQQALGIEQKDAPEAVADGPTEQAQDAATAAIRISA